MEEKLRKLMKHEGLNSTRLAELLGIQASGISHIMSGRNNPSYDFLLKLLQRFPQLNPDWLLLDKGPMYRGDLKVKIIPESSANRASGEGTAQSTPLELFAPSVDSRGRDDVSIIPANDDVTAKSHPDSYSSALVKSSSIERIVVFYKDKTFSEYKPG